MTDRPLVAEIVKATWVEPDGGGCVTLSECEALFDLAREVAHLNLPAIEIGSNIGRSGLSIAAGFASAASKSVLTTLDIVPRPSVAQYASSLGLSDYIRPLTAHSVEFSKTWTEPLGLVFVDGEHFPVEVVIADLDAYARFVVPGGVICGHDYRSHPGSVRPAVDSWLARADNIGIWSATLPGESGPDIFALRRSV